MTFRKSMQFIVNLLLLCCQAKAGTVLCRGRADAAAKLTKLRKLNEHTRLSRAWSTRLVSRYQRLQWVGSKIMNRGWGTFKAKLLILTLTTLRKALQASLGLKLHSLKRIEWIRQLRYLSLTRPPLITYLVIIHETRKILRTNLLFCRSLTMSKKTKKYSRWCNRT